MAPLLIRLLFFCFLRFFLQYLHSFVFCHKECPDDFQILTNFPRRVLDCQPNAANPEPPTLKELGLGKSELLFIHDNEA